MLIKVVSVIETIVQVDFDRKDTLADVCNKARDVVTDDRYGVLQADLKACNKDAVILTTTLVSTKNDLSPKSKELYAWTEDGDTTDKTCGEILS